MTTELYKENWEKANKWLQENAPDYVVKCVQELADTLAKKPELLTMKMMEMLTASFIDGTIIRKEDLIIILEIALTCLDDESVLEQLDLSDEAAKDLRSRIDRVMNP